MAGAPTRTVLHHVHQLLLDRRCGRLPDEELLEHFAAQHDEAAFAALVRRHGPLVLGVCRRVLGNAADAEDAFQATFLVLVRRARPPLRPRRRPPPRGARGGRGGRAVAGAPRPAPPPPGPPPPAGPALGRRGGGPLPPTHWPRSAPATCAPPWTTSCSACRTN